MNASKLVLRPSHVTVKLFNRFLLIIENIEFHHFLSMGFFMEIKTEGDVKYFWFHKAVIFMKTIINCRNLHSWILQYTFYSRLLNALTACGEVLLDSILCIPFLNIYRHTIHIYSELQSWLSNVRCKS